MQRPVAVVACEMHVPEDEVIDLMRRGIAPRIGDQRLGERSVEPARTARLGGTAVGVVVPLARLSAPPVPETHRPVGMYAPREEPPQRPRAEDAVEQAEHRLSVDVHVVAVGHEDAPSAECEQLRRSVHLDAAFARQVVAHPHVVVTRQEGHAHAPVGQFGQFAQRPHEAFGHHAAVFEPEIEDVAHQEDRLRIAPRPVEPGDKTPLDLPGCVRIARTEVYVRGEIVHQRVSSSSFSTRLLP